MIKTAQIDLGNLTLQLEIGADIRTTDGDICYVPVVDKSVQFGTKKEQDPETGVLAEVPVFKEFNIPFSPLKRSTDVNGTTTFTEKTPEEKQAEIMEAARRKFAAYYAQANTADSFPAGTVIYSGPVNPAPEEEAPAPPEGDSTPVEESAA